MPTTLIASILLLYRKGISETQLAKKVSQLGLAILQRGGIVSNESGLPSKTTIDIGLKHLDDYIVKKRNMYFPKVDFNAHDFSNYIMLGYYRNPLNFIFFNESLVICSMFSFTTE